MPTPYTVTQELDKKNGQGQAGSSRGPTCQDSSEAKSEEDKRNCCRSSSWEHNFASASRINNISVTIECPTASSIECVCVCACVFNAKHLRCCQIPKDDELIRLTPRRKMTMTPRQGVVILHPPVLLLRLLPGHQCPLQHGPLKIGMIQKQQQQKSKSRGNSIKSRGRGRTKSRSTSKSRGTSKSKASTFCEKDACNAAKVGSD